MTETPSSESSTPAAKAAPSRKSGGALGGKVLAELKEIAVELNIEGASGMRKGQLIDAIKTARGEAPKQAPKQSTPAQQEPEAAERSKPAQESKAESSKPSQDVKQGAKSDDAKGQAEQSERGNRGGNKKGDSRQDDGGRGDKGSGDNRQDDNAKRGNDKRGNDNRGNDNRGHDNRQDGHDNRGNDNRGHDNRGNDDRDEESSGGGRRRNRRGRGRGNRGPDGEPTYTEDDVLVPAAGILDILDNYAFVRTTGYLPSENDVYLSLSMVRKLELRKGDAVTGQVRQPREGERKEKFNPMVRIDTVNGASAEESRRRAEFSRGTPVFPTERLRLETEAAELTTRFIDLFAPFGKGQRGLIAAAPQAGRTSLLRATAEAITANHPECHLMVVLIDERPEEVTQMQRAVKGEVIASTFDRPSSDHTTVAELAIERAKRLVELGHDVVVLLDSLTRLGRAYQQSGSSGRGSGSGGIDAAALHPAKKFFGAARNLEEGGSLTILATALVETGSSVDEAIFEEFAETANSELRLRRDFAGEQLFPAIDLAESGTRREELLLDSGERAGARKLRGLAADTGGREGLELILERLRKTPDNSSVVRQASA